MAASLAAAALAVAVPGSMALHPAGPAGRSTAPGLAATAFAAAASVVARRVTASALITVLATATVLAALRGSAFA